MKKIISIGTSFLILLFTATGLAQSTTVTDTISREAPIFYDVLGNKVDYRATMPELNQIAGAPKAYYSYYWELGDGNYSFEKNPKHTYTQKGEYKILKVKNYYLTETTIQFRENLKI